MALREIKFHLVQPEEFFKLKEDIVAKYPQAAGIAEGVPFDTGKMGYKLTYRYLGTDLVIDVDGPSMFMGSAVTSVQDMVFDFIGSHSVSGA